MNIKHFAIEMYYVLRLYKRSNILIIKELSSDCAEIYAALKSAYYRKIKSQGRYKMESASVILPNSHSLIIATVPAVYCNHLNRNQNCLTATNSE